MKELHITISLSLLMLTFFCTLITQFALQIKEQNEQRANRDHKYDKCGESNTIRILTIFNLIMTILLFPFLHILKF